MALNQGLMAALNPTTVRDFQIDNAKNALAQQMGAAQLQNQQVGAQNAQEEMANKRRSMAVSLLNGIASELDPTKQAALYATIKPMAERYDTTLKLPDTYDASLAKALTYGQISPKDQLAQQVELQKAQMMGEYRDSMLDVKQQGLAQQAELARLREEEKQQQKTDTQARQYSETIDKNGLTDLLSAVNNTVQKLTPYTVPGADVPGFGPVAGMLPDFAVSQGGKDLRQAYAGVRNSILKARSGGAVTPSEGDRLLQELGEGTGLPDEQVITGIMNVSQFLKNRIGQIQAGYKPEAIEAYKQRGGNVTTDAVQLIAAPPKVGATEDGYVFLGGDPSDPASWKQAR